MIDFRLLVKNGVHFGHQTSRWSPRMAPYIWGAKNGVHLINVAKTAVQLEKAAKFLEEVIAEGKTVMWIGTKKPAQSIMTEAAKSVSMPYVTHRWIGGTLTNNPQVKKSVTKYLHLKDVIARSNRTHYTKKEFNVFQKMVGRLEKNIGGIVSMNWPVGAIVVVDVRKEFSAVKEAAMVGIPVIALVDTNNDPLGIDYVIPANDDSPRAIKVVVDYLAAAAAKGREVALAKKQEEEKEQELLHEKKRSEKKAEDAKRAAALAEKAEAEKAVKLAAKAASDKANAAKAAEKKAAEPVVAKKEVVAEEKKAVAPKKAAPKAVDKK